MELRNSETGSAFYIISSIVQILETSEGNCWKFLKVSSWYKHLGNVQSSSVYKYMYIYIFEHRYAGWQTDSESITLSHTRWQSVLQMLRFSTSINTWVIPFMKGWPLNPMWANCKIRLKGKYIFIENFLVLIWILFLLWVLYSCLYWVCINLKTTKTNLWESLKSTYTG